MSHTVYNTDAIVLSRVETGEADVTMWLLTKELGLVVTRAQGARKETAKMRGQLQTSNVLSASMVKGRHLWRLTGAEQLSAVALTLNSEARQTFAKVAEFIRRMTVPDQAVDLYPLVLDIRVGLAECIDVKQLETLELLAIARLLIALGHMDEQVLSKDKVSKRALIADVNNAISESHL